MGSETLLLCVARCTPSTEVVRKEGQEIVYQKRAPKEVGIECGWEKPFEVEKKKRRNENKKILVTHDEDAMNRGSTGQTKATLEGAPRA